MNSAGVDSKSVAEKGSLGDTTFHLSSALALLIVRTMLNLPLKSTTMCRDDLRQKPSNLASVHLGLNLFTLSRTGSLSQTRSPKPASGVPNLRPFRRLNGVSPSAPTMHAVRRGPAPRPSSTSSSTTAFVVHTRLQQSRWLSQQSHCLQSHLEG